MKKQDFIQQYKAFLVLIIGMGVIGPLLVYQTITHTRRTALEEIHQTSAHTLNLVVENLRGELARFQAVPHLLAADPLYRKLWDKDLTPADLRHINLQLERNKNITGALDLYIMNREGLTIAASNWQSPLTFIGRNFSFRPYFQQAMQGSLGRYFALGTTSRERGYYLSYPIRRNGEILGVMVCKIQVGHFEEAWKTKSNDIIVSDRDGIIFLSSNSDWLFRSLLPLAPNDLARIRADRQYGTAVPTPLKITNRKKINEESRIIKLSKPRDKSNTQNPQIRRDGNGSSLSYLQLSKEMALAGWQVHILSDIKVINSRAWQNSFGIGALLFSLAILTALLLERARRVQERITMQNKARSELEQRVSERTKELQQAQSELVKAGKLAALGKMSAGLSHELNQPLAAIRSYSDNARIFLDRDEPQPAHSNLKSIGELTDRMARIIKHLRTYASKDKIEAGPTDIIAAVRDALSILNHRIAKENITILDHLPNHPTLVYGGAVRLQQVFVNILSNACDAIAGQTVREIGITLDQSDEMISIIICDTGPGLSDTALDKVFDPFFSTKEVGEGVGLGLSISYGIVQQFGGRIEADNCDKGGAALKVSLKRESHV